MKLSHHCSKYWDCAAYYCLYPEWIPEIGRVRSDQGGVDYAGRHTLLVYDVKVVQADK